VAEPPLNAKGPPRPPPGFSPVYRETREPLPDRLKPLLSECWPAYEHLRAVALRPAAAALEPVPRGPSGGGGPGRTSSAASAADAEAAAAAVAAWEAARGGARGAGAAGAGAGVAGGSHAHAADPRNADVLVGVRDGVLDTFDLILRSQVRPF
jgi:hypothetical protein